MKILARNQLKYCKNQISSKFMVEHLKIASKQDVIMGFNEWKELRIASKNSFEDKNSRELSSLLSLRHVGCFSFSFSWRLCHLYTSSNIFWSKIESNDYTVDYAIVNILCSYSSHKYFIITMYFYSYRYTANEEEIWCEWVCNMIEGLCCPVLDDRYWILNLVRRQSKTRERKDEDEDILFEHAVIWNETLET